MVKSCHDSGVSDSLKIIWTKNKNINIDYIILILFIGYIILT